MGADLQLPITPQALLPHLPTCPPATPIPPYVNFRFRFPNLGGFRSHVAPTGLILTPDLKITTKQVGEFKRIIKSSSVITL